MTSQGFRACKQALWSSFQSHARLEPTTAFMECLALDRDAFEASVLAFVQTPDLILQFPYEDPLVVREALSVLARRADMREKLWSYMQANVAAMEATLSAHMDETPDARMTITMPSEASQNIPSHRATDTAPSQNTCDHVNWTCYHCSLFVFLNDVLRCHVEPAALRQCRRALTSEVDEGETSHAATTAERPGRPSLGLVPEARHGSPKKATARPQSAGTGSTPLSAPSCAVYSHVAFDKELRCMLDAHSLPREGDLVYQPGAASSATAVAVAEVLTHSASVSASTETPCTAHGPSHPACSSMSSSSASLDVCPIGRHDHQQQRQRSGRSSREASPPARVVEAAERERYRTHLQLSTRVWESAGALGAARDAEREVEAMGGLLEGSVDVPSPSPIHAHDHHPHDAAMVRASETVSISRPSTVSVRGRSTIEISVDLNEEDTEEMEETTFDAARPEEEQAAVSATPFVTPVSTVDLHPPSPQRAPPSHAGGGARLRERSPSLANQITKNDGKGRSVKPLVASRDSTDGSASRPVQCIRTRGWGVTGTGTMAEQRQEPVAGVGQVLQRNACEQRDEADDVSSEEGRRTTALTLDGSTDEPSDAGAAQTTVVDAARDFDPVLKTSSRAAAASVPPAVRPPPPAPVVHQPVAAAAVSLATHRPAASAPSPSLTPCERDEERHTHHDGRHAAGTHVALPQPRHHRTPRRGALPEPHRAPQIEVNPCYNGVAPTNLCEGAGQHTKSPVRTKGATATSVPAAPPVVGIPFALRSTPQTPRSSATVPPTSTSASAEKRSHHEQTAPESPSTQHGAGAGEGPFSRAARVTSPSTTTTTMPPSLAGVRVKEPVTSTSTPVVCASRPPPARPPSRDRRARASKNSPVGRLSGRGSGCSNASAPAPVVPRSRASSRGSGVNHSRQSSPSASSLTPPTPPPRTPSRHASPFFRIASQNTPPTPPRSRPTSPLKHVPVPLTRTPHRREPFYESTANANCVVKVDEAPKRRPSASRH